MPGNKNSDLANPILPWLHSRLLNGLAMTTGLLLALTFTTPCSANEREKAAAARIEQLGGRFMKSEKGGERIVMFLDYKLENKLSDEGIESIDFAAIPRLEVLWIWASKIGDRSIKHFGTIPTLQSFHLGHAKCTNDGLSKFFAQQRSLRSLSLRSIPITDKILPEIAKLNQLRSLAIIDVPISDKGLKDLARLKDLSFLDLSETDLTDAGLPEIAKLANLKILRLDKTGVTDIGLQQLCTLKKLHSLSVISTKVTDRGKKALCKLLPDLEFP